MDHSPAAAPTEDLPRAIVEHLPNGYCYTGSAPITRATFIPPPIRAGERLQFYIDGLNENKWPLHSAKFDAIQDLVDSIKRGDAFACSSLTLGTSSWDILNQEIRSKADYAHWVNHMRLTHTAWSCRAFMPCCLPSK